MEDLLLATLRGYSWRGQEPTALRPSAGLGTLLHKSSLSYRLLFLGLDMHPILRNSNGR